jgi:hypothetical protein
MPTSGRGADVGREKVGERGKRATSETLAASGRMRCFALSYPPDWLIMLLRFKYRWGPPPSKPPHVAKRRLAGGTIKLALTGRPVVVIIRLSEKTNTGKLSNRTVRLITEWSQQ